MKNERKKCNNVFISTIIKFYFYISIFCKCNFKIVKIEKKKVMKNEKEWNYNLKKK